MSVNKIILVGRVGKDPEVKEFDNGGKVVNFTLATDDSYKNKDGDKIEQTDWHNVKCNRPGLVGVIESYVKKGSQLYLEGKIKTRKYEKDGEARYATEVVIDQLRMLGGKSDNQQAASELVKQQTIDEAGDLPEEDSLPF